MKSEPLFIKCTRRNGNGIYINVNNITYIETATDGTTNVICGIWRICEDTTTVKESIDEIYEKIEVERNKLKRGCGMND